ncbi:MAG TPA: response regulator [Nitrospiraceae bacterium]|nr:response regulator [Nitrospiraceae bacterium]
MPTDLQRTVRPKVLVADDEPNWLRVLSLYLKGRQCDVTTALDGHEAMQKILEEKPDLIIADITMPGMDGYELCRRLRRDAATRTIPFIFLTARDHETERMKARRIGADEYLTKPCSLDRVVQSVDTAMERIEQAKKLSLERIGWSGRIDDIDILDLIQALELEQRTGALVLSHGDRTGTIYIKDGVIVEADIRSPAREEPLFRLLGWKTGRFAFIPDAVPEQTPITASMAHLLFEDLRLLEDHERKLMQQSAEPSGQPASIPVTEPVAEVLTLLESVGHRYALTRLQAEPTLILRVLVVGTAAAATGELIHGLVTDLSGSKWAALELQDQSGVSQMDIGRVRLSAQLALHLVAVRGEQRFWPVWEEYLPDSIGAIFMLNGLSESERAGLRSYLIGRDIIAPSMPVVISLPPVEPAGSTADHESAETLLAGIPAERTPELILGARTLQPIRLLLLSRLLQRWLLLNGE